jgi:hypothetical protein
MLKMRFIHSLLTLGLVPLLAGCETVQKYSLTYRLWEDGELTSFSEPAPEPHLALFEATNRADVVVEYDALSEKHDAVRRRAYYLGANQERILAGKRPKWTKTPPPQEMTAIPVRAAPFIGTDARPDRGPWAVMTRDNKSFDFYTHAGAADSFDLPVFRESSNLPTRVVLTPFAVAGDAVMVGGVAAVLGFLMWVQGGAPTH